MDKKRLFQCEVNGGGPLGRLGLCSIGMAAPYAWIAWFLTGPTSASGAPFLARSLYPGFVVACVAILLGVLAKRAKCGKAAPLGVNPNERLVRTLDVGATLALVVAGILSYASAASIGLAASFAGVGVAWPYCRWLALYARLDLRDAIACICGSVALASILKILAAPLEGAASSVFGCALALLGLIALLRFAAAGSTVAASASPDAGASQGKHSLDGRMREELGSMAVALGMLCFVLGVAYNVEGAAGPVGPVARVAGFVPEILAALALWMWVCRSYRSLSASGICCVLSIVIASGLLILALLGDQADMPMFVLLNVDHSLLTMFLWILLVDVSQRSSLPAMAVAAAGWGLRSALFVAGGAVAQLAGLTMTPTLALALVYALLVVLVVAVVANRVGSERILARLVPQARTAAGSGGEVDVAARCAELAATHGLTARESEILALLCRGRSRPYIAETLYLSENTVRNHVKHIYAKLGIHDRQSLLSLVNGEGPEAGQ